MSKLVIVGTVAFDAIETPFGKTDKILGGAATFIGLAASQFNLDAAIVSVVERSKNEEENLIEAIIQQECSSIHPSVSWKFRSAAKQFLMDKQRFGNNATFKKISFNKVYPFILSN